ncbi:MAG TPA: sigma-70 family RNA polymerase sigma factor [Rhodanobacteraceae bacterium]|nr:sigma-70 family RNA polymerase sigma factor [Rhodanobacteraceae bacterium]
MTNPTTTLSSPSLSKSGFGQELDRMTLERARRGDMDACAAIYRRYGTACFNLAFRILGERAAAEDVVQEVFLKVMNTLPGFRGDAPFGVWLKRMSANATIDALRANQRFADEDPEALFASMASRATEADARVDAWTLLMRLSPRARAVLVLHELEGYTHKELSELFGQSESYSKSILARALRKLGAADDARQDPEDHGALAACASNL